MMAQCVYETSVKQSMIMKSNLLRAHILPNCEKSGWSPRKLYRVPTLRLVLRAIQYFVSNRCKGVIIVPRWEG